jgi:hypothetical protein
MSKTTKYIIASLGIIVLVCFAIGLPLVRNINDRLMGNKTVYLNCDQLPDIKQVEAAIKEHGDMIKRIEEINPGLIFTTMSSKDECPEKGFLVIVFGGYNESVKIEALLGDTFFGIPYQLENH